MSPEILIGIVAVFISGGAVGTTGTLVAVWLLRKFEAPPPPPPQIRDGQLEELRSDVWDMSRRLQNIDQRLDFQEQLLGGVSPTTSPPARLRDGWDQHGSTRTEPREEDPTPSDVDEGPETPPV